MRAFCAAERERIDARLRDSGRTLFRRYGLKKTSVHALASAAEIADGSFYAFYPSKENLYLSLALEAWEDLRPAIEELAESLGNPRRLLSGLIERLMKSVRQDPLLAAAFRSGDGLLLARCLSPQERDALRRASFHSCAPLVRSWQARGAMIQGDPEAISGFIVSAAFMEAFRDAMGDETYFSLETLIAPALATGLAAAGSF